MSLRSDLLRGDLRCLYLGWLLSAQNEEFAEDELEPAVPAGLGELSAPLRSLIEFLGIDEDLVEVAASASAPLNAGPDREELAASIQSLPEKEKNNLLVAAVSEPGERWKNGLLRRFEQQKALRTLPEPDGIRRRTAGDLLTLARPCGREDPFTGGEASGRSCAAENRGRGQPRSLSGPTGEARRSDLEPDCSAHPEAAAQRI